MGAIANVDQAEAWDGNEGNHWTTYADRYDTAMAGYHGPLLDAAAVRAGETVLDVGCGCGQSTVDAGRHAVSGAVVGVDLSSPMLRRAAERARAAGVENVSFERVDAQVHPFDAEAFDLVISRFGAMFFSDLGAAFDNIGGAVRPGGRVALVAWSSLERNEWIAAVRAALAVGRDLPAPAPGSPGPFGLGDPARTRSWLEHAGFAAVDITEVEAPFVLGADVDDAYGFMCETGPVIGLTKTLDEETRTRALESLRAMMGDHAGPDGVAFGSSAWLITATKA
jgi:SAM-dependent methyltransferase